MISSRTAHRLQKHIRSFYRCLQHTSHQPRLLTGVGYLDLNHDQGLRWFTRCQLRLNKNDKQGKVPTSWKDSTDGKGSGSGGQRDKQENDDDDDDDNNKWKTLIEMGAATAILGLVFMFISRQKQVEPTLFVSWNEFLYNMLAKGEVEQVRVNIEAEIVTIYLYRGAILKGQRSNYLIYLMKIPETSKFEEKLRQAERDLGISSASSIPVSYHHNQNLSRFLKFLIPLLIVLPFFLNRKKLAKGNFTDMMFSQMRKAPFTKVDPRKSGFGEVKFKDVAGLQEAKVEIMEFVDYLKNPQKYKDIGAKIPRGALLLGPPGCGKTLLARAVSTEANVPFLAMAGSEFVEMIGGLGASRVRDLFKEAKQQSPCIIYIDEIDAIGKKRSSGGDNSEEDHTLNQLLVEMDGMGTQEDVIMLAATNRADMLDQALLRPGRFDRHITIDYPTLIERKETFDLYLHKLKLKDDYRKYSHWLAQLTPGMTGADINNVCNESAIHAATNEKTHVDKSDLEYALERIIAGTAKKSSVLSKEEKTIVAYHECGHALVGWLLPTTDALLRISIVPRTSSVLGFSMSSSSEIKLYSTQQLFERMCMALGGRVAESVTFNRVTSGAQNDLTRVTKLAYDQIRSYGMNEKVGCVSYSIRDNEEFMTKPYSKSLAATIDEESRHLVSKAYQHTEEIIKSNTHLLKKMATALMERETLTYDDVYGLIGAPPHGEKSKTPIQSWEEVDTSNDSDANNNNDNDLDDSDDDDVDDNR